MSNENNDNVNRPRRGSVGNAVFSNLFQRTSSTSPGSAPVIPSAINMNDAAQRRRLSVSTLGVHGASPTSSSAPYHFRRASTSTNSESIDESAVDEDDSSPNGSKNMPITPFRRMSMSGAPRGFRNGSISATGKTRSAIRRKQGTFPTGPAPGPDTCSYTNPVRHAGMNEVANTFFPPDQSQFNWSEQLRSRAESSVSGSRGSFSFGNGFGTSPPRPNPTQGQDRAKSIAEMPAPPAQSPPPRKPKQPERQKPDAFQERILKGDFYMD